MRSTHMFLAGLAAVTLSSTALAGYGPGKRAPQRPGAVVAVMPPAAIQIDNDSGLMLDVFVDGTFRGKVRNLSEQNFTATPGLHSVTVKMLDGTVLYDQRVKFASHRPLEIEVEPPLASLVLHNDGVAPLYVTIPHTNPFWMLPNTRKTVKVTPGLTAVQTSMYAANGLRALETHKVRTVPAGQQVAGIGWSPPPPASQLTVRNQDDDVVRIFISGNEAASLRPGKSQTLEVRPGRHDVLIISNSDGVLFNDKVNFNDDQVRTVRIADGRSIDEGCAGHNRPPNPWRALAAALR